MSSEFVSYFGLSNYRFMIFEHRLLLLYQFELLYQLFTSQVLLNVVLLRLYTCFESTPLTRNSVFNRHYV